MPISNEVVHNVTTNVCNIAAVVLTAFVAMMVLEKIVVFAVNAFSDIKPPDGWLKRIKLLNRKVKDI